MDLALKTTRRAISISSPTLHSSLKDPLSTKIYQTVGSNELSPSQSILFAHSSNLRLWRNSCHNPNTLRSIQHPHKEPKSPSSRLRSVTGSTIEYTYARNTSAPLADTTRLSTSTLLRIQPRRQECIERQIRTLPTAGTTPYQTESKIHPIRISSMPAYCAMSNAHAAIMNNTLTLPLFAQNRSSLHDTANAHSTYSHGTVHNSL